ncbi:MAG: hypothetical protein AAB779_01510, partial [Patescibacteria group bacterium]
RLRVAQGKLKGRKINGNWFTRKDWVDEYVASAQARGFGASENPANSVPESLPPVYTQQPIAPPIQEDGGALFQISLKTRRFRFSLNTEFNSKQAPVVAPAPQPQLIYRPAPAPIVEQRIYQAPAVVQEPVMASEPILESPLQSGGQAIINHQTPRKHQSPKLELNKLFGYWKLKFSWLLMIGDWL